VSQALSVEDVGKEADKEALAGAMLCSLRPPQDLVLEYPVAVVSGSLAEKALGVGNAFLAEHSSLKWLRLKQGEDWRSGNFRGFVQNEKGMQFLAEFSHRGESLLIQPRKKLSDGSSLGGNG
jgi:hypothetical protein